MMRLARGTTYVKKLLTPGPTATPNTKADQVSIYALLVHVCHGRPTAQIESLVRYIFVNGPSWLGSWEGQSVADICSGLTKIDASHWQYLTSPCEQLIDRKVHATIVGLSTVGLAALAWHCVSACSFYWVSRAFRS
jgi:hypothetical protein